MDQVAIFQALILVTNWAVLSSLVQEAGHSMNMHGDYEGTSATYGPGQYPSLPNGVSDD